MTTLDRLLSSLAPLVPIHLLPGPTDPAGQTLPQQPLPRLMFSLTSAYSGFTSTTNPAWFEQGGKRVLATAGQGVEDAFKYVPGGDGEGDETRLELARRTLEWRCMAPTAPDTLCQLFPFPLIFSLLEGCEKADDLFGVGVRVPSV